jgi:hypothetical protein
MTAEQTAAAAAAAAAERVAAEKAATALLPPLTEGATTGAGILGAGETAAVLPAGVAAPVATTGEIATAAPVATAQAPVEVGGGYGQGAANLNIGTPGGIQGPGVNLAQASTAAENPYSITSLGADPYSLQSGAAGTGGITGASVASTDPIMAGFKDAWGLVKDAGQFAQKNPLLAMAGLKVAGNVFGPKPAQPQEKKYSGPGYDMRLGDNFQPSLQQSNTSVYRPSYAAGGILSFDQGGIAANANSPQGMGNNQSYPQGQQDHTQYATPTQMPTSSSVIDSGYEQNTNPYSGEPVGYASGGQTYDAAGLGGMGSLNGMGGMQNPAAGLRATSFREGDMGMGYLTGRPQGYQGIGNLLQLIQSRAGITGISPNFQRAEDVVPQVYVPSYAAGGQTKPDDSRIAYMGAPNPWGSNQDSDANTAMLSPHEAAAYRQKRLESLVGYANRAKAPQAQMPFNQMTAVQQAQMAAQGAAQPQAENVQNAAHGGIMGADSSLGGYAAGGNPRLLKGPGDGMSDNIPAVIANKQPARLADGEFVIPADVVSHLGNGSTDAGAQHLHTMMNKVRKARTGNSKQGKQIDPNKFLPA